MLNTLDVVFSDNRKVRNAWANYFQGVNNYLIGTNINSHQVDQLRINVLKEIATDLGINNHLTDADFFRIYEPQILFRKAQIENFEINKKFEGIQKFYEDQAKQATTTQSAPVQPGADPKV